MLIWHNCNSDDDKEFNKNALKVRIIPFVAHHSTWKESSLFLQRKMCLLLTYVSKMISDCFSWKCIFQINECSGSFLCNWTPWYILLVLSGTCANSVHYEYASELYFQSIIMYLISHVNLDFNGLCNWITKIKLVHIYYIRNTFKGSYYNRWWIQPSF